MSSVRDTARSPRKRAPAKAWIAAVALLASVAVADQAAAQESIDTAVIGGLRVYARF